MRYYGPRPGWHWIDFGEIWRYRELIWAFAMRDLKVRYRQTIVGIAWALIQPLTMMLIFGTLFGLLNKKPSSGQIPYGLSALCGLVPWQFVSSSLTNATASIVENANLIQKVYFPKILLPVSAMIPAFVDFFLGFVLLFLIILSFGILPGWSILLLPVMMIVSVLTTLAVALWLSALNAIYRDIQYIVPFLLQVGMFVSPVIYETDAVVPAHWQWLYALNPLVFVFEGFRWVLLGQQPPQWHSMLISLLGVLFVLTTGAFYFRRMERFFSDRI